ncbi:MAG: putative O-glycosylation ligase, exosortase A system-associated [Alphaproteobacteria bacterium]|nr:putative O-glycosylation ligase, exosortase A system-associated [Alphaproteobacteria bacterium]
MRGFGFFLAFVASLPFIFVTPFNGVMIWYVFSLGNFHTLIWGGPFASLNYAYVIAILTCLSWAFSRTDKKQLPITPLVALTLLFSIWITFTSWFALAPSEDVWTKWITVQKILFMCLVGYALTTTRERLNQLIWVVALTIGLWGVKGALWSILHGGSEIHGPDGGMLADNNDFGLGLILILPLLFYQRQLATNRHVRRALLWMGFLVTLAIVFTYSRGALVGVCAMGAVFWLRSRAKFTTGLLIAAVAICIYGFAPEQWFKRMSTIETYQDDGSAMSRLHLWQISLRIAQLHPVTGGGFRVTFWPTVTNNMLRGTDLERLAKPRATHSIYFDALSEHGWVGLFLFVTIFLYSWANCSWLVRRSRDRPDLAWANLLGRMGQAVLVGYATAGTFASQAYLDEYWCIIFIFDAARRMVSKEIAPTGEFRTVRSTSHPVPA